MLKITAAGIVGVVVGLLLGGKVATDMVAQNLGGIYNTVGQVFPTITVQNPVQNATTTMVMGRLCMQVTESDGGTIYWFARADGNLGTTTAASCLQ